MIGRRGGPASGTAVVTGAGAGLGAAIAARLAGRGLHVVAADIDLAAAERTAARVGGTAHRLDVADLEACRSLVGATPDLAVWVNNAGILATGPGWSTDEATRRRLFDVNVHGVINGTTAALEAFRPAGRGHVVNVVSLAGLVPAPDETIYGATKHAALAFSVGTQLDLARRRERGVRISALCPDGIWTPMLYDHVDDPDAWPSWSGTMLRPEDVAAAAVELLDRPSPVRSIPRRRGLAARFYAATPGLSARGLPALVWLAHRRQRAWARDNPRPAVAGSDGPPEVDATLAADGPAGLASSGPSATPPGSPVSTGEATTPPGAPTTTGEADTTPGTPTPPGTPATAGEAATIGEFDPTRGTPATTGKAATTGEAAPPPGTPATIGESATPPGAPTTTGEAATTPGTPTPPDIPATAGEAATIGESDPTPGTPATPPDAPTTTDEPDA